MFLTLEIGIRHLHILQRACNETLLRSKIKQVNVMSFEYSGNSYVQTGEVYMVISTMSRVTGFIVQHNRFKVLLRKCSSLLSQLFHLMLFHLFL